MILDNINPNDLFPTETKGPSVLGIIEYHVQGQSEFEGAFIATSERLIMNVDMNGQFYYRNIPYNEIESINMTDDSISFTFNIGKVPMTKIKNRDIQRFVDYVSNKI
ncbi:PH domain-containing protein [Staphylococcus lugdunensis]|uniref:PH domain-containing protein n=1 Tax=Staphylococcus lugdunensis TaxID=28035 RepID=UPI001F58923C|nr:PH domain-containing protein [Staphylococcus lugdunensis]MCI2764868.1 PH domain-containing protein [Staphylococcus lugdunensis]MCI2801256.1 PH domain-containing protein [Staphylococcus lugdunensis]